MGNSSDELRDKLAEVLLDAMNKGDVDEIDPRVLAVARAFIKDNPPEDLPTPDSNTGVLDEALEALNGGKLPFGKN